MVKTAEDTVAADSGSDAGRGRGTVPTAAQRRYLERGIGQPGGKLPLFDADGGLIGTRTIESCIANGWAERWFANPVKPDWLVCRLTVEGRRVLARGGAGAEE